MKNFKFITPEGSEDQFAGVNLGQLDRNLYKSG